jgi:hypothetical protein
MVLRAWFSCKQDGICLGFGRTATGIRAGNLNIAAAVVLGADNISVSGTSTGTPVADTSAVTAASSGATNADGGTAAATAALSSNLADAARAAEELKQSFKPTFISAEVVGHGE